MISKSGRKTIIPKHDKHNAIERIVAAVATEPWFEDRPPQREGLRFALSDLYDRGLVLRDELALFALALARRRYCRPELSAGQYLAKEGVFAPEDLTLLRVIFDFASKVVPAGSAEASALGRRVVRLYRAGYRDPSAMLNLLDTLKRT
ncbi:hypothetical protein J2Y48_002314 [Mycoplana sp. BE70]|uniref:hypothetical protein n=1 Tax=Mycoplana sp. BE70 TaxID=2817775 RepID=UPI002862A521|nr:hypothetical protein [Mycoplana sp. BE70]MDR6757018.1 hypothetical protein [Mycoplana sp. BE70]